MARTRGASAAFHMDDGELLDKEGKAINPLRAASTVMHMDDGEIVLPAAVVQEVREYQFLCDSTTWNRNMEAFEAMHLLNVLIGDLSTRLDMADFMKLPADVRRHFRRVPKSVEG